MGMQSRRFLRKGGQIQVRWLVLGLAGALVFTGCGRERGAAGAPTYAAFVRGMTDPDRLARLDVPQGEMLNTYDRRNGNNDFNNFQGREGGDWAVLADLEGPGVVTRFWTTGGKNADQRFQFYFDGEKKPRIDATVAQLRRGDAPFIAELSRYEQSGWYSYAPIPFARRLRVLAQTENFTQDGWPRLFYQLNHARLPTGAATPSLPSSLGAADVEALRAFAAGWAGAMGGESHQAEVVIAPGATQTVLAVKGPAIIRELALTLGGDAPDVGARASLFLRIHWDGAVDASVATPLEAFGGKLWQGPDYQSAYGGCTGLTVVSRLPMPLQTLADIRLENQGAHPVTVRAAARVEALAAWRPELGRLHATWRRSGPDQRGQPHPILQAQGRGKVAGCVLAVSSMEPSWWVLEGDERILIDGESFPGWHGTGLEDYFNGAWYYRNNLARPLHGLAFKRPYMTVQYRFHPYDARTFAQRVEMSFERGPDHASTAWMESVGYCYLATPAAAGSEVWNPTAHRRPADPFELAAFMTTLGNYERFGDYAGALRAIDDLLSRYPGHPDAEILSLRRIATRERLEGIDVTRGDYEAFMRGTTNELAREQARLLLWFHESPRHALLSLQCGNPTRATLDGATVAEVANPQAFTVVPITLTPGPHVLALHAFRAQYPEWVQAGLRTHQGLIGTDRDWAFAFDPTGNWRDAAFDASAWGVAGDTLREGPPPAPHVYVQTHPFVDMHGLPWGIFVGSSWPDTGKSAGFRRTFHVAD